MKCHQRESARTTPAGGVVLYAYGIKSSSAHERNPQHRDIMLYYIHKDPMPHIRAIVFEDADAMLEHLDIYRNPDARFHVKTWYGECVLTPLALAVEFASFNFAKVLSVLVNDAGINPNKPYVIDYFSTRLRICTNALTHLLARWDNCKSDECHTEVLHTLLRYGADVRAPALYEVTPHVKGKRIPRMQHMLSAASGQSLMAFQMLLPHDVPPPCHFIPDLIKLGHARFLPSDPDGLFVKWAREAGGCLPEWGIHVVMDFLCPSEITGEGTQIAGGLLAPGKKASGELRRLVQSFDSVSKMNILQFFVAEGIGREDTKEFLEKLRMLRHVYDCRA